MKSIIHYFLTINVVFTFESKYFITIEYFPTFKFLKVTLAMPFLFVFVTYVLPLIFLHQTERE